MIACNTAFDCNPADSDARARPARQCCSACGSVRLPRAAYCVECGGCLLGMSHAQWVASSKVVPTTAPTFVFDEDDDDHDEDAEIELGLHDLEVISFDAESAWLQAG